MVSVTIFPGFITNNSAVSLCNARAIPPLVLNGKTQKNNARIRKHAGCYRFDSLVEWDALMTVYKWKSLSASAHKQSQLRLDFTMIYYGAGLPRIGLVYQATRVKTAPVGAVAWGL
jgi:hypothetical protein